MNGTPELNSGACVHRIPRSKLDLDLHPIHDKKHDIAQAISVAVAQNTDVIIAAGGDGTVADVAAAIGKTQIPLGIIPRGTANNFATAVGIPQDIYSACNVILSGRSRTIDTACCNGKLFLTQADIGFKAETLEIVDRQAKNRFGVLAYILASAKQLQHMQWFTTTVETDNRTLNLEATAITIANAVPPTSPLAQGTEGAIADDGLLDITITTPQNRLNMVTAAYQLLRSGLNKTAVKHKDVISLKAKSVKAIANPQQRVALDGNLEGNTPVEIECIPASLNVVVPT